MDIEFDETKREKTLVERRLDMADARLVFAGPNRTVRDLRHDYGEERYITVGLLHDRMVFVVWTPRGSARRVISMRKANEREQAEYGPIIGT